MPLYEYKCHSCGKTFEVIQKFSDEPVTVHAGCGGEVEKLVSAPAFHLKGTGWYATDYAKNSGAGKTEDHKGDSHAESNKADSREKADSKTETAASTSAVSARDECARTDPWGLPFDRSGDDAAVFPYAERRAGSREL